MFWYDHDFFGAKSYSKHNLLVFNAYTILWDVVDHC